MLEVQQPALPAIPEDDEPNMLKESSRPTGSLLKLEDAPPQITRPPSSTTSKVQGVKRSSDVSQEALREAVRFPHQVPEVKSVMQTWILKHYNNEFKQNLLEHNSNRKVLRCMWPCWLIANIAVLLIQQLQNKKSVLAVAQMNSLTIPFL